MTVLPPPDNPDLDCRANIEAFVEYFYQRILADPQLAPIFIDVADIDLAIHLPHIKNYWCKLLLGDSTYQRHTMQIHRQLHSRQALRSEHFDRWLACFNTTMDTHFAGEHAQRGKELAASIARNMQRSLKGFP